MMRWLFLVTHRHNHDNHNEESQIALVNNMLQHFVCSLDAFMGSHSLHPQIASTHVISNDFPFATFRESDMSALIDDDAFSV